MASTETTETVPDAEVRTLVFKDGEGGYFLLPRTTLEQGRVPDERKREVERLIVESQDTRSVEGDDTQGHFWPIIWAAEIAIGAAIIIGWSGPEVPGGPSSGGGSSPGGSAPPSRMNQGGTSASRPL